MVEKLGVIACVAALPASIACAEENNFAFELTPVAGYAVGGEFEDSAGTGALELDDSGGAGLILNVRHSANTQWEILYARQSTRANGSPLPAPSFDLDVHYIQAGGTYLGAGDRARPYLSATLGATHFEPGPSGVDGETFLSFSLGAGFRFRPHDRLGFRLEARGYGTALKSDSDLFCQTDPTGNICAVRAEGTVLWQIEALAGLVFRF